MDGKRLNLGGPQPRRGNSVPGMRRLRRRAGGLGLLRRHDRSLRWSVDWDGVELGEPQSRRVERVTGLCNLRRQEVGNASFTSIQAGLWTGTASSWVDLNPTGASRSQAWGVCNGQQVGSATFPTGPYDNYTHAALWNGSAVGWTDLNPSGVLGSEALGTSGDEQVGDTTDANGHSHAALWRGSAASWADLSALLPSGVYSNSGATGVYTSGGSTWVVGYAYNSSTTDAFLWEDIVPEPSSILVVLCGIGALGAATRRPRTAV